MSTLGEQTIRKVQRKIIPVIVVLYVVAFVDRINISFAALTMNGDLGITHEQYGVAFGIFFFGYFLFEIPSNLVMHKVGARTWIARILVTWGIIAALTGLVRNVSDLYVVRALLGFAKAGFAPGMLLYLTYWFRQREQGRAVALPVAVDAATRKDKPDTKLLRLIVRYAQSVGRLHALHKTK